MTGTEDAPVIGRSWQSATPERQNLACQHFDYMAQQEEMTESEICELTGLDQSTARYLVEGGTELSEEACQKILAHSRAKVRIWLATRLAASKARKLPKRRSAPRGEAAIRRKAAFKRLGQMKDELHLTNAEMARLTGLEYFHLRSIVDNPSIKITRGTVDKILGVTDESILEVLRSKGITEAEASIDTDELYYRVCNLVRAIKRARAKVTLKVISDHTELSQATIARILEEPPDKFLRYTLLKFLRFTEETLRNLPEAPTDTETTKLRAKVEERREAANHSTITIKQVCARAGLSYQTVKDLLSGKPLASFSDQTLRKFLRLTDDDMVGIIPQVKDRIDAIERNRIQYREIRAHTGLANATIVGLLKGEPLGNFRPDSLQKLLKLTDEVIDQILADRAANQTPGGIEDE